MVLQRARSLTKHASILILPTWAFGYVTVGFEITLALDGHVRNILLCSPWFLGDANIDSRVQCPMSKVFYIKPVSCWTASSSNDEALHLTRGSYSGRFGRLMVGDAVHSSCNSAGCPLTIPVSVVGSGHWHRAERRMADILDGLSKHY